MGITVKYQMIRTQWLPFSILLYTVQQRLVDMRETFQTMLLIVYNHSARILIEIAIDCAVKIVSELKGACVRMIRHFRVK
jgi:hypothetical protein